MTDSEWMPLGTFIAALDRDPVHCGFMRIIETHSTRRTITVATRKYKARRRRRR